MRQNNHILTEFGSFNTDHERVGSLGQGPPCPESLLMLLWMLWNSSEAWLLSKHVLIGWRPKGIHLHGGRNRGGCMGLCRPLLGKAPSVLHGWGPAETRRYRGKLAKGGKVVVGSCRHGRHLLVVGWWVLRRAPEAPCCGQLGGASC